MQRVICFGFGLALLFSGLPSFAFKTPDGDYHAGVVQLSVGAWHTCALMADFHVSCWGTGLVAVGLFPAPVPNLGTAIQVASGNDFACALLLDHTVSCWGNNSLGQLGDGTHSARPSDPRPVKQGTLVFGNVKSIAAGDSHVCAVKGDSEGNTVWCWGSNTTGQLGNYTVPHSDFRQPIQVVIRDDVNGDKPLAGVESVGAGNGHTCALLAGSHTIACWGWNRFRQIGNVDAKEDIVESPVGVKTLDDRGNIVDFIAAGGLSVGAFHNCVLTKAPAGREDFSVACWGDNSRGEAGDFGSTPLIGPSAVLWHLGKDSGALTGMKSVTAGNSFSCSVGTDEENVSCWGDNTFGETQALRGGCDDVNEICDPSGSWFRDPIGDPHLGIEAGGQFVCVGEQEHMAIEPNPTERRLLGPK